METNPTIGKICFTCHFVDGSQAQGCYIEYKCTRAVFNGNVAIKRTLKHNNTASKCVTRIYTSYYNVTFYDVEHNNNIYKEEYAVKKTEYVTGLSPIPTSSLSVPSSTDVISSSPSPATLCTDCDNSKLLLI